MLFENQLQCKPFLKWAGGKTQLIPEISTSLPTIVKNSTFDYYEPFVGSGAILFWMLSNFPNINKAYINDANEKLINLYKVIKESPAPLINELKKLQKHFLSYDYGSSERKEFFYSVRKDFNDSSVDSLKLAAYFIFINRTCFNGLYRVNSKGDFNVPMGDYKNPKIVDEENIRNVSAALNKVLIFNEDYTCISSYINSDSFVYLDPPYKPLSETSNFNSYGKDVFDDNEQFRLKEFCDFLDSQGAKWMLSNSDVKNTNTEDEFFDDLYMNYKIRRVSAKRIINSNSQKRGQLTEILVSNY